MRWAPLKYKLVSQVRFEFSAAFNLRTVPALLARRRKDPWADMDGLRQRLPLKLS